MVKADLETNLWPGDTKPLAVYIMCISEKNNVIMELH